MPDSARVCRHRTRQQPRRELLRTTNASDTRVAALTRLGFTPRSWYSASSRRRKRFSAATDRRGLTNSTTRPARSASNRRTIRTKTITLRSCHSSAKAAPRGQFIQDRIFAEDTGYRRRGSTWSARGAIISDLDGSRIGWLSRSSRQARTPSR
jgi:hypothetical protein